MEISWEISGLKELDKKLAALGADIGIKALRAASRAAMKPVKAQMVATAPFDENKSTAVKDDASKGEKAARSQHMRDKISITTKKLDKKGGKTNALAVRVGPTKAHAQKAISAEFGNNHQSANPFMRPALFDNKELVVRTMKTRLAAEIAKHSRA